MNIVETNRNDSNKMITGWNGIFIFDEQMERERIASGEKNLIKFEMKEATTKKFPSANKWIVIDGSADAKSFANNNQN